MLSFNIYRHTGLEFNSKVVCKNGEKRKKLWFMLRYGIINNELIYINAPK